MKLGQISLILPTVNLVSQVTFPVREQDSAILATLDSLLQRPGQDNVMRVQREVKKEVSQILWEQHSASFVQQELSLTIKEQQVVNVVKSDGSARM